MQAASLLHRLTILLAANISQPELLETRNICASRQASPSCLDGAIEFS